MHRRDWLKMTALMTGSALITNSAYARQTGCWEALAETVPDDMILLGSNENPYGPGPRSIALMQEAMRQGNRYPYTVALKEKIAQRHKVSPDQVMLGAGSSELLGLSALTLARRATATNNFIAAKPTFFVFPDMAARLGARRIDVPLTDDKVHDLAKMAAAVDANTCAVYVCNPNNPTGTKLIYNELEGFIKEITKTTTAVVDEVYHDFIDDPSLIPETATNPRLIVIRSFSKVFGLAGMRVGYAIAHPDMIKQLAACTTLPGFTLSQPTVAAALGALEDTYFYKMSLEKNQEAKAVLTRYLDRANIRHIPSYANLVYFSLDGFDKTYLEQIKARRIIVREVIEDSGQRWCRASIGKPEEMALLVKAIQAVRVG
jgi:histidinol-phosphate aminotransferase